MTGTHMNFMDAFANMINCFRAHGFEPPKVITLASHEEGMRLIGELSQRTYMVVDANNPDRFAKTVIGPDGTTWKQVELIGVLVRYPAVPMALQNGKVMWI